jgi:hypothetical protein
MILSLWAGAQNIEIVDFAAAPFGLPVSAYAYRFVQIS